MKLYKHFEISYPKFHKMDQLCKLGFLAAEILLKDSGHQNKVRGNRNRTNTQQCKCEPRRGSQICQNHSRTGASPALFVYTLPNIVIGEISIRHHFKGENAFFVFKQFDGNFMAEYVNGLFDNNLIKNCICGWVDILKEDYRAILFLVEDGGPETGLAFTAENLNQLNKQDHG